MKGKYKAIRKLAQILYWLKDETERLIFFYHLRFHCRSLAEISQTQLFALNKSVNIHFSATLEISLKRRNQIIAESWEHSNIRFNLIWKGIRRATDDRTAKQRRKNKKVSWHNVNIINRLLFKITMVKHTEDVSFAFSFCAIFRTS